MSDSVISIFEISDFFSTNIFIFVDHFVYHFKIEIFLYSYNQYLWLNNQTVHIPQPNTFNFKQPLKFLHDSLD